MGNRLREHLTFANVGVIVALLDGRAPLHLSARP